ncbi:hypothetical protein Droror1_Dr00009126 [Drosera rotundifolia]
MDTNKLEPNARYGIVKQEQNPRASKGQQHQSSRGIAQQGASLHINIVEQQGRGVTFLVSVLTSSSTTSRIHQASGNRKAAYISSIEDENDIIINPSNSVKTGTLLSDLSLSSTKSITMASTSIEHQQTWPQFFIIGLIDRHHENQSICQASRHEAGLRHHHRPNKCPAGRAVVSKN